MQIRVQMMVNEMISSKMYETTYDFLMGFNSRIKEIKTKGYQKPHEMFKAELMGAHSIHIFKMTTRNEKDFLAFSIYKTD